MTDMIVREYRPEDIPALSALWARVFGDSVALIGDFFRLLPDMGTGLAAEADGEIAGAAYIITGMELADCGNRPPVCGYIYAVAVEERFRGLGLGGRLTLAAAEKGRERGASIICTLPAESALYNWYEKLLGVQCALYRAESRLPPPAGSRSWRSAPRSTCSGGRPCSGAAAVSAFPIPALSSSACSAGNTAAAFLPPEAAWARLTERGTRL